jgi:hypothetical protein
MTILSHTERVSPLVSRNFPPLGYCSRRFLRRRHVPTPMESRGLVPATQCRASEDRPANVYIVSPDEFSVVEFDRDAAAFDFTVAITFPAGRSVSPTLLHHVAHQGLTRRTAEDVRLHVARAGYLRATCPRRLAGLRASIRVPFRACLSPEIGV